jgi:hypothetical protein
MEGKGIEPRLLILPSPPGAHSWKCALKARLPDCLHRAGIPFAAKRMASAKRAAENRHDFDRDRLDRIEGKEVSNVQLNYLGSDCLGQSVVCCSSLTSQGRGEEPQNRIDNWFY